MWLGASKKPDLIELKYLAITLLIKMQCKHAKKVVIYIS